MIGQSLSNTNETCYSVQIAKICNLNKALNMNKNDRISTNRYHYLVLADMLLSPVVPVPALDIPPGVLMSPGISG